MHRLVGRFVSGSISAGGWLLLGVRTVLDLIGYSTLPEDAKVAADRLDHFFLWLLSVPWWAVLGFALVSTMWLMWVSWPREAGGGRPAFPKIQPERETFSSIAANMRFAQGRFRTARKALDKPMGRLDLDEILHAKNQFRATEISLRKKGFKTPWLEYEVDPIGYLERNLQYIDLVEPLIYRKHYREAKSQARILVEQLHPKFVDPKRL